MRVGPVIVNNTPLVALWVLDRLDLLRELYDEVLIPQAVSGVSGSADVRRLTSKLYVPRACAELVSRPRLIERLNAGLHRKLTPVSAGAPGWPERGIHV